MTTEASAGIGYQFGIFQVICLCRRKKKLRQSEPNLDPGSRDVEITDIHRMKSNKVREKILQNHTENGAQFHEIGEKRKKGVAGKELSVEEKCLQKKKQLQENKSEEGREEVVKQSAQVVQGNKKKTSEDNKMQKANGKEKNVSDNEEIIRKLEVVEKFKQNVTHTDSSDTDPRKESGRKQDIGRDSLQTTDLRGETEGDKDLLQVHSSCRTIQNLDLGSATDLLPERYRTVESLVGASCNGDLLQAKASCRTIESMSGMCRELRALGPCKSLDNVKDSEAFCASIESVVSVAHVRVSGVLSKSCLINSHTSTLLKSHFWSFDCIF